MKTKTKGLRSFISILVLVCMLINIAGIESFAATKPEKPSIYYAKSSSYNSALIKWEPIDNVDGYILYRSLKKDTGFKAVATIKSASTVSYTDKSLVCGTTYYYTLRTYKGSAKSDCNAAVAVKIVPATPSVKAKAASTTSTTVTWAKVAGASGYILYCSTTSTTSGWKKIATITNASTVTYTHKNLAAGNHYCYTVIAYRTVSGTDIKSGCQKPGAYTHTTPATPKLSSAVGDYSSVTIKWEKVANANQYYVFRKAPGETKWTKIATISGGSTISYKDATVTCGQTYTYTVRAIIKNTYGTWASGYSSAGLSAKVAPTIPSLTALTSVTSTSLKLTWSKVTDANGYRVYRKLSTDKSWTALANISNGATTSYTDKKLTTGKTYVYTVKAYVKSGKTTVWSGYVSKGISAVAKPKTPTLKTGIALSETSARVTYEKIDDANGYYIYRKTGASGSWSKLGKATATDVTNYTDKTCKVNTTYYYTVRAYKKVSGKEILSDYVKAGIKVVVNERTRVQKNQDLNKINPDLKGWLQIKDTIVDFPVMQDPYDDDHYLRRDLYDQPDDDGCLILDSNCNIGAGTKGNYADDNLPSSNLIIYGHKRPQSATSGMFRDLALYNTKSYADKHKNIVLTTTYESRTYQVIAAFYSEQYKKDYTGFKYYQQYNFFVESEFKYFYNNIKKLSLYDTGVTAKFGDEFITLSTCAWYDQNGRSIGTLDDLGNNTGRFVVIAKRIG